MRKHRKTRTSISLATEVVEVVDRYAQTAGLSRSAVMEEWLRYGAQVQRRSELDASIEAYYAGRTPAEVSEDEALTLASAAAARRLTIDELPPGNAAPARPRRQARARMRA